MRYVISSKTLTISELLNEVTRFGGKNIRVASATKLIFCDLENDAFKKLSSLNNISIKQISTVKTDQVKPPPNVPLGEEIYSTYNLGLTSRIWQVRHSFTPPLTGEGYNIAVLDSGIRTTHRGLRDKVIYSENFTSSPTSEDVFDHGTGVAWIICGGRDVEGEEQGIAPGVKLFNIKVLDDTGEGTSETVVMGIERIIELRKQHSDVNDPMRPGMLNLSLGTEDTGDPDDPIRVACRTASDLGMGIIAAAGNSGPAPGTIMSPACDERVAAVGSIKLSPFQISNFSSRGPTKEGLTKPDVVFFGESLMVASAKTDDSFVIKSGTSFAAPFIAGEIALAREFGLKVLGIDQLWGWKEWIDFAAKICIKPAGVNPGKDNEYGYGMPYGDLLLQQFKVSTGINQQVIDIMGIGLMGLLISKVFGAAK